MSHLYFEIISNPYKKWVWPVPIDKELKNIVKLKPQVAEQLVRMIHLLKKKNSEDTYVYVHI